MLEQRECPKGGFRHKVLAQPWAETHFANIFFSSPRPLPYTHRCVHSPRPLPHTHSVHLARAIMV